VTLNLEAIEDPKTRENFEKLLQEFAANPFLNGNMRHFELELKSPETYYAFKHNLGFKPEDVFITFVEDGSTVTVEYDLIDRNFIYFTFYTATRIRFFAGNVQRRREGI
jgi:hypothetical protein